MKTKNIAFALLFLSFFYSAHAEAKEKIFQVVASWDMKQTTVRSACFYNLEDARSEKKAAEQSAKGGNNQFMAWIETTCENIEDGLPESCVYVFAEKVRSGWSTRIENTCKKKVSLMVGGVRFNLKAITIDGSDLGNEASGHILSDWKKSNGKFIK